MNTRVLVLTLIALASAGPVPAAENTTAGAAAVPAPGKIEGKVAETMNVAGYTYLLVESGGKKVWAAAPEVQVKPGDRVVIADAMPMANYHSKTLNRTFDVVYFSGSVAVNGRNAAPVAAGSMPAGGSTNTSAKPAVDLSNIARAANGKTVAEVYKDGSSLAGKPVTIRGRVVKYNGGIMGRNWLHIRDGSGAEGTNDLTITSKDTAKVGDTVVVTGMLAANRDFGGGYKYALIVENASVTVE